MTTNVAMLLIFCYVRWHAVVKLEWEQSSQFNCYGTPSFKHWRPYTTVLLIVCSRKTEKINRSGSLHPNQGNGTLSSFFFIYYLSFDILSYFSRLGSIRKDVKQNISRAEERLFFTTCESTISLFLLFFFLLLLPFSCFPFPL